MAESTYNGKFSSSDDERIIDFVKPYECLYNVRHPQYRDRSIKERLWKSLAASLHRDHEAVRKRWQNMRDCFKKHYEKMKTGSAALMTSRDESLMFLFNNSDVKSASFEYVSLDSKPFLSVQNRSSPVASSSPCSGLSTSFPADKSTPMETSRKRKHNETEEVDVFLENAMDFPSPEKKNKHVENPELRHFCDSIYNSMLRLNRIEASQMKLAISRIAHKFEMAHEMAKPGANVVEMLEFEDDQPATDSY